MENKRVLLFGHGVIKVVILLSVTHICKGQDFSYDGETGPYHWGEQYNTCDGKYQSPINIDSLNVQKVSLPPLIITGFEHRPRTANLKNNGHTVLVTMDFPKPPRIRGGPLRGIYEFAQFHFHWGDNDTYGSEDTINNKSFPVELHMVFYKSIYKTFDNALHYPDGVTVLAFFYEVSNSINHNYEEFTSLLTDIVDSGSDVMFMTPPRVQDLISDDIDRYYTYNGSLTTPPCSEVVTWIDFATPIPITPLQITRFRNLHSHNGQALTHNFRPIQPLNGRIVYHNIPVEDIPIYHTTSKNDIDRNDDYNDIEFEFTIIPPRDKDDIDREVDKKNVAIKFVQSQSVLLLILLVIVLS